MKRKTLYLAVASVIFSGSPLMAQDDDLLVSRSAPEGAGDITEIITLGE